MGRLVIPEYSAYFDHLVKYRDELASALENEREKRQSLLSSDMDRLEAVLSLQQAQTMKLRTMEAKRAELQAQLSSSARTASEFVAEITDAPSKAAFEKVIAEMTEHAGEIREQNRMALEIAKTNLKLLERVFPSNSFDQSKAPYKPEGGRTEYESHSMEIKL